MLGPIERAGLGVESDRPSDRNSTRQESARQEDRQPGVDGRRRSPLLRYILFQIPGALLTATALVFAVRLLDFSPRLAIAIFVVWIVKDAVLYPSLRIAYEAGTPHGAEALVGASGTIVVTLSPEGWVQIGAERWRARLAGDAESLAQGAEIRVRDVNGLILLVEAADAAGSGSSMPS
jgi:membrane protein implicated in regulation of membrane protease activity